MTNDKEDSNVTQGRHIARWINVSWWINVRWCLLWWQRRRKFLLDDL